MRVSVIVPALNSAETLAAQLRALSVQTYPHEFEVIVADNGSGDGTTDVARGWETALPNLLIVDASRSRGVSVARNEAAKRARGEFLLFCDADDEVDPAWIDEVVAGLSRYDVVGGHLSLEKINSPRAIEWRTDPAFLGLPVAMGFLPYAIGANFAVKAAIYEELGGCDEGYFGGHDDVEFCWRAQLDGYSLGYAPKAVVEYRLRSKLSALALQRYRSGFTYAQLFAQYRHLGIEGGTFGAELGRWLWLLLRSHQLLRRRRAGQWVFAAAWHWGRLRGSHSARVLCPD